MRNYDNPSNEMLSIAVPTVLRQAVLEAATARRLTLSSFARQAIAKACLAEMQDRKAENEARS